MTAKTQYSKKYVAWAVFLAAATGSVLTLVIMHFLIAANAYDPTTAYRVQAAGTDVSCLSVKSIQGVCNVSREIIDTQAYVSYNKGYKDAETRCKQ